MLAIYIDSEPAVVVPTRMHEPGFYVRRPSGADDDLLIRSEDGLRDFQAQVEGGKVARRDGPF